MGKWPAEITAIRHVKSAYNAMDRVKESDEYKEFADLFDREFEKLSLSSLSDFPSPELLNKAKGLLDIFSTTSSDYDTDIAPGADRQAVETGRELPRYIHLPDVIYVSPYKRTRLTLEALIEGWPELRNVKTVEDDRIREQEYGMQAIFNDWRLYFVFNPQQALLSKRSTAYEYKHQQGESLLDVRDRLRIFLAMLIREHGGKSSILDNFADLTTGQRESIVNILGATPKLLKEPERVLLVTHHLSIMALKANLARWTREKFLDQNKNNRPPNCSVNIFRPSEDERMELFQENLVLYSA